MSGSDGYDAQQEEAMQAIPDEAMDHATNLHRAEKDGWFYSDHDGAND